MRKSSVGDFLGPESIVVEAPDRMEISVNGSMLEAWGKARRGERFTRAGREDAIADGETRAVRETRAVLYKGLAAAGLNLAADLGMSPGPTRRRTRAPAKDERIRIRVAVQPGEAALLLVEVEGHVFTWLQPDAAATLMTRTVRSSGIEELVFTITAPHRGTRQTRGPLIDWAVDAVTKPVRVLVLKYLARLTIDAAIARIEGDNPVGVVEITGKEPQAWRPRPGAAAFPKRERPLEVLLLVHGTFSSTAGSFGALTAHPAGEELLDRMLRRYDAVLGFDHKTLAHDVETNAGQLAEALIELPHGAVIHAIAYSRGGLVFRVLAEEILARTRPDLVFRKVIFVGCTNGGTSLAAPANWEALANLYTNILMAGARTVALLASGGVLDPLVRLSIKTLGEFVQILPKVAIEERRVPGLASMMPKGSTIERVNAAPDLGGEAAYHAVTSNFEPIVAPNKGLSRQLKQLLLDRVTDDLFQTRENDLVVDTASMTTFGGHQARFQRGSIFEFGTSEIVYHTVYFAARETCNALANWLGLGDISADSFAPLVRAALRSPSSSEPGPPRVVERRPTTRVPLDPRARPSGGFGGGSGSDQQQRLRVLRGSRTSPPPETPPSQSAEPAFPTIREGAACNVAAQMAEAPVLGGLTPLEVILSQEEIAQVADTAHTGTRIVYDPVRLLRIRVLARSNCEVVGNDETHLTPPPQAGRPASHKFQLRGQAPGPAELWVDVSQEDKRVARLVLQPVFVADGKLTATAIVQSDQTDRPLVDLRIFEENLGQDRWRLRFLARCTELGMDHEYVGPEIITPKTTYISGLYKTLEDCWADTAGDFAPLMQKMRARGIELFRGLFPPELQQLIWDRREQIGSIQVYSYEPSLPWEVAHLAEPGKHAPLRSGKFLAELGLTRWMSNIGLAPVRLRVRPGKARYCIPNYLDTLINLPSREAEIEMVVNILGATPIDPHPSTVLEAIAREQGEDYDVLHFSCHGQADPDRIWDSGLQLAGYWRGDTIADETLSPAEIRAHGNLMQGGIRPLVFLNACQSGVGGYGLSGSGGLAQAFVERGAGVFVGTLWSVEDRSALGFSRAFYEALKNGCTLTEAARLARDRARQDAESTWLAYTIYGHPYARVQPFTALPQTQKDPA